MFIFLTLQIISWNGRPLQTTPSLLGISLASSAAVKQKQANLPQIDKFPFPSPVCGYKVRQIMSL
jgi:hypothetical protein